MDEAPRRPRASGRQVADVASEAPYESPEVAEQGIGVCEVTDAQFQLLFDAGMLYQAYGFYPQQLGFSFNIPSSLDESCIYQVFVRFRKALEHFGAQRTRVEEVEHRAELYF